MRLLFVGKVDASAYGAATFERYVSAGKELGHEVVMFGERPNDFWNLPFTTETKGFDAVVFVVYQTTDFPDLPYLAQLLDNVPKDRRVVIDPTGRFNETIRVDDDFNHLEKLDGHQGWEWIDAMRAVSTRIYQPTLKPRHEEARSFLFYGYDPSHVAPRGSWDKPYGLGYIGNNWQRWAQIKRVIEAAEPMKAELGKMRVAGWDWEKTPQWIIDLGVPGILVERELLERVPVEAWGPLRYNELIGYLSEHRFTPVLQRPLFNELGLVTNRVFETFMADTIPLVSIPEELAVSIYGDGVKPLLAGDDPGRVVKDGLAHPERAFEAVSKVRQHLAAEHSMKKRFAQLAEILEG
ncbi:MAG: hypothetical protein KC657_28315 [Myxococcales bacterium]|nr:hypothetical protein [Myxococcales bacterium]